MEKSELLEYAITMAKEAGEVLLSYFRKNNFDITTKSNDYDVVTTADKASENLIVSSIRAKYPDHSILTEESGNLTEGRDYRWVIDPLDGTTNFSQGLPVFSVSIALEYKGEPILGVVYAPYLDELFYSQKESGSFLNGKRLRCGDKTQLAEAVVATGIPYDKRVNPDNNLKELSKVAPKVRGLRRLGSAAIDLCYVAAGYYDAFWELNLNRWDVAAGILIAKEAGARLYSIREHRNQSILMVSPGISNQMLEILLTPEIQHDIH